MYAFLSQLGLALLVVLGMGFFYDVDLSNETRRIIASIEPSKGKLEPVPAPLEKKPVSIQFVHDPFRQFKQSEQESTPSHAAIAGISADSISIQEIVRDQALVVISGVAAYLVKEGDVLPGGKVKVLSIDPEGVKVEDQEQGQRILTPVTRSNAP